MTEHRLSQTGALQLKLEGDRKPVERTVIKNECKGRKKKKKTCSSSVCKENLNVFKTLYVNREYFFLQCVFFFVMEIGAFNKGFRHPKRVLKRLWHESHFKKPPRTLHVDITGHSSATYLPKSKSQFILQLHCKFEMQFKLFSNTVEIIMHGYIMFLFLLEKRKGLPHCSAHWA